MLMKKFRGMHDASKEKSCPRKQLSPPGRWFSWWLTEPFDEGHSELCCSMSKSLLAVSQRSLASVHVALVRSWNVSSI